jgi:outer membrane usher protein
MTGHEGLILAFIGVAILVLPAVTHAAPADPSPGAYPMAANASGDVPLASGASETLDLYLTVSVNGAPTRLVAAFRQAADGSLSIEADQLRNVGIIPVKSAIGPDGRVRLDRLPSVSFVYDDLAQTIDFTASDKERAPKIIDATAPRGGGEKKPRLKAESSTGALLNYNLVAGTDNSQADDRFGFSGLSGAFEARVFSPYGVLTNTFIASTSDNIYYDSTRLDSSWRYSDEDSMISYTAGDLITGGLTWTRPTRLGGMQVQRSFSLRSDLVTFPVPELSGSAAVPSTVDVYLNEAKRFSSSVDAGPFDITNLPFIDGSGNARVVVTDAQGQEVATESSFISSSQMLARGLYDFSAELGYARKDYGVESNNYDENPYGSATMRTGITNWMTGEAHAEGGADLINGGLGAVFASRWSGVVSLSASGSYHDGELGQQVSLGIEKQLWGVLLRARVQRSFDSFQDIASVTADDHDFDREDTLFGSSAPPKALDQISVSLPLMFDKSNLNFSYTNAETVEGRKQQLLGISYSRQVFNDSTLSISAVQSLSGDGLGVYASLSVPIGPKLSATTSLASQHGDTSIGQTVTRSQGQQIGDYGWRVGRQQSDDSVNSASASYRASAAKLSASVDQRGSRARANVTIDGALVAAGGGVFASNRIDDAFAIVDAGAPDVEVQYQNRPVGRTKSNGKLILPRLRAYQENNISIDPKDLPIDAVVNDTRTVVIPADRSGIVVRFDVNADANAALVTFSQPDGKPVEVGASGTAKAGADPFVVGYDGQTLVENLKASNLITITLLDGSTCVATFPYKPQPGKQVSISDAICKP